MPSRPNLLWIVTTQWRGQATGYAGDANARTPWLDGLASEAVNYVQAVTPHPLGPQARAALLTGQLCPENGVSDYWDPLPVYSGAPVVPGGAPPRGRTIAHALAERQYRTAFVGKWHLAPRDPHAPLVGEVHARTIVPPDRRGGFAFWEGFEGGFLLNDPWLHGTRLAQPTRFKGYQADVLVSRAAAWCAEQEAHRLADGQPYFCVLSLEAPHPPYRAPTPHVAGLDAAQIQLRANVPRGGPVEAQAREELAGYYAHIEATDRAVGRLLAEVNLAETVVIFTSVHGDLHGSHGLFRKAWPFEESVRVPLLVRAPVPAGTAAAGTRDESPISLVDLPALTLAFADGREWRCTRDHALISMPSATEFPLQCPEAWRGFRTPRRKFVLNENGRPWLCFDLEHDPLEQQNLVDDPARRAEIEEWRALL